MNPNPIPRLIDKGIHLTLSGLALCLGACIFDGGGTAKPHNVDYFSGDWEQVFPQGRIRHTWLPGNKFETKITKTAPAGDTVFSDAIYRYTVSPESSLIHYSLDSVIESRFPVGESRETYHFYYRGRGDSLLLGPTGPSMAVLPGVPGKHIPGSLFGEWSSPTPPVPPLIIGADSTGSMYGMKARFLIDADHLVYLLDGEEDSGSAFYYQVLGDSLRLWKAKYDCGDSGCYVDDEYILHKAAVK